MPIAHVAPHLLKISSRFSRSIATGGLLCELSISDRSDLSQGKQPRPPRPAAVSPASSPPASEHEATSIALCSWQPLTCHPLHDRVRRTQLYPHHPSSSPVAAPHMQSTRKRKYEQNLEPSRRTNQSMPTNLIRLLAEASGWGHSEPARSPFGG
jgi:hypothetical protein